MLQVARADVSIRDRVGGGVLLERDIGQRGAAQQREELLRLAEAQHGVSRRDVRRRLHPDRQRIQGVSGKRRISLEIAHEVVLGRWLHRSSHCWLRLSWSFGLTYLKGLFHGPIGRVHFLNKNCSLSRSYICNPSTP